MSNQPQQPHDHRPVFVGTVVNHKGKPWDLYRCADCDEPSYQKTDATEDSRDA